VLEGPAITYEILALHEDSKHGHWTTLWDPDPTEQYWEPITKHILGWVTSNRGVGIKIRRKYTLSGAEENLTLKKSHISFHRLREAAQHLPPPRLPRLETDIHGAIMNTDIHARPRRLYRKTPDPARVPSRSPSPSHTKKKRRQIST